MSKFNNLQQGEVLSETQFYTVVKKQGDRVQLATDDGNNIVVDKNYVNEMLSSAAQFTDTKKVTRTELTHIVLSYPRIAMTVHFNKQVKEADVKKALYNLYPNKGKIISQKDFEKQVRSALSLKGEERVMKGRHYGNTDNNGRIQFIDMGLGTKQAGANDARQRLVDPRTLNWAIIDGVKYVVK